MLDLEASINLMPFTIYKKLGLNELRPTKMSPILADQSARQPRGIVEDVLIQVEKLIIPVDFVVLDMEVDPDEKDSVILLGFPFMATTKAVINVHEGKLTLKVLDEVVEYNVFESLAYPIRAHDYYSVDIMDGLK